MDTPTAPFIAILESDGTDNDDWITDHAGDPDAITWTNFTEGVEAIVLTKKSNIIIQAVTGVVQQNLGSGITYDQKFGKRFYQFTITGIEETWAKANFIDQFAMHDAHTTGTGFKRIYLVVKKATSDYKQFTDQNNARQEYCACNLATARVQNSDSQPLLWNYTIQGFSVWR